MSRTTIAARMLASGGVWTLVASQSPSASSGVTITGLSATAIYRLDVNLLHSASSQLYLRFNGDSSTNYRWAVFSQTDNAGTGSTTSTSDGGISLARSNVDAGTPILGCYQLSANPTDTTKVFVTGTNTNFSGGGRVQTELVGGRWAGSGALTSLTLLPSSGTFTGLIKLSQIG